jgi:Kef-type K+ transport system membrane component KefB
METLWAIAAIWAVLALLAGMTARRTGISVALVEIVVGILAGNFLGVASTSKTEWVAFLAGFGSILLTFMAGAEIEPGVLKKYLKESLLIGCDAVRSLRRCLDVACVGDLRHSALDHLGCSSLCSNG